MANIHILGCHHALQSVEICRRWTDWRDLYEAVGKNVNEVAGQQKGHFAARLREIVRDRAVTVIGEEFDEGVTTLASCVVENWYPIDMPAAVRVQRRIPVDYTANPNYREEQRTIWTREREAYMVDKLLENIGDATNALVIVGGEHIGGLVERLENAGHTVTSENVTEADWYDPPLG